MDILDIEKESIKEDFKAFEKWRKEINDRHSVLCNNHHKGVLTSRTNDFEQMKFLINGYKRFPNLIVRLTRQMCECDEDCTIKSLSNFELTPCPLMVMSSDYKEDDKYYENLLINKKVVDGTLIDDVIQVNDDYLRNSIKDIIQDLCDDKKGSLRKLKCKAYEMKDHCGNDQSCMEKVTLDILPSNFRTCPKLQFSEDLDNIGFKIGDPMILKHVRVSRDLRGFEGIDYPLNNASNYNSTGLLISLPIALTGIYCALTSTRKLTCKTGFGIYFFMLTLLAFYTFN